MPSPGRGRLAVLALNLGSASVKLASYRMSGQDAALVASGILEPVGLPGGRLVISGPGGAPLADERLDFADHAQGVRAALRKLDELRHPRPEAVGHRIVHGGPDLSDPAVVDAALVARLRAVVPLAPLHLPIGLLGIEAAAAHFPGTTQVACFDTAFHRDMPEVARRYPLPERLWHDGVRRYGFHGLSYQYVVGALGRDAGGRVIIAHLGHGASLAAVRDGRPLDTTMGFSPTGGFMMSTRSGDLDPGVLVHLLREGGYDDAGLERLVNRQSGLLGVSGTTSDMKTLLENRQSDSRAGLAVEMFCYAVRKQIGAYAAALGGLDTLVFTGGIGEHAAPVRALICGGLGHLGILIDEAANSAGAPLISPPGSACAVRIIPTDEELVVARLTYGLVAGKP